MAKQAPGEPATSGKTKPTKPVLELSGVVKNFGQVKALIDGQLSVTPGSIHALVGENGAGKSTLIKIVSGVYRRDSGKFIFDDQSVDFSSTGMSKNAGIAVIYQEPTLFPDLSVAENIFIGRFPRTKLGFVNHKKLINDSKQLFDQLGVNIDPNRPADGLSIADQQLIEIAKAISLEAKLLIMDEPTAALSGVEVERLFTVARRLRDEGKALIFVSHRFDEVFDLCDTVTVMRDGSYIATHLIAETTVQEIVREMVGRDITGLFPKSEGITPGKPILEVKNLNRLGTFHNVSFEVHEREIVGIAGLVGAGRSEIVRAIFGIDSYDSGTVIFNGSELAKANPVKSIEAGIAFVPEDRRKQGLVLDLAIGRNISMVIRKGLSKLGLITDAMEYDATQSWAERLKVKAANLDTLSGTLSGGNQQKVVLAKWLATKPKLLIIDEPTRGIDVGTKSEVHKLLDSLAAEGMAIIMISSELPEILGMSDRILVIRDGEISAELSRGEATQESIMTAAIRQESAV